ncbi:MAG: hypothetical protein RJR34_10465 [Candidatus Methanoculleus thermohydrogenotrophicum]|nr:hypothetical protein [Candidatus Methanoculleus thermohydrogenotrophicum]
MKSVDEDAKVSSAPRIAHPPRYLEIRWGSTPAVVFPRAGKITFHGNTVPLRMSAKMLYRRLNLHGSAAKKSIALPLLSMTTSVFPTIR